MICQHIRPKWGDAYIEDVRPALVQTGSAGSSSHPSTRATFGP
jgi:hypothetical protein